jgi:hypothetical protein
MSFPTNTGSRSPVKESKRPLPEAGQSLRNRIEFIRDEQFMPWVMITLFAVMAAGLEWLRWWAATPYRPIMATLLAIVLVGITFWKMRIVKSDVKNLRLGLEGERYVGQRLQGDLIPLGYRVFHDICIDNFNIDHVAIGPAGVFVIEVKTRSKEIGRDKQVTYDGSRILIGDRETDRSPLIQVRASTKSLETILYDRTGKRTKMRGIVVFPGWFVKPQPKGVETWVLNEKALGSFVENEPSILDAGQIHVLAEGLARDIRERLDKDAGP